MESVFIKILNMGITAGFIVLAVVALRLLLRRAPKYITCLLWLAVAIRLICPVSPESVFSLIPSPETIPAEIVYSPAPTVHTGIYALNTAVNPIISESLAPTPGASVNPVQIVLFVARIVWVAGVIIMFLYALISYLRIYFKTRESIEMQKGVRRCDGIPSPFILGIIRPVIFIPTDVPEDDIKYVLAHEKAHIKRFDHIWKPLGFLLLSVYWFNPLLWLAYVLMCRDIEFACDEGVIKKLGNDAKKPYSKALLDCSVSPHIISACPLAFGEVDTKSRIKSVLSYKKPAVWIIAASSAALVILAVCFLTNPKEEIKDTYPVSPVEYGIAGKLYGGEKLIYSCGIYSSVFYTDENMPQYMTDGIYLFTSEIQRGKIPDKNGFYMLGSLEETHLTEESFDRHFLSIVWEDGYTAEKLRTENKRAFAVRDGNAGMYYYMLEQADGTVFITYGYIDDNGEYGNIRYIFRMRDKFISESEDYGDAVVLVYRNSVDLSDPKILLNKDGTFTFTWSVFSSYIAHGKYELDGENLTLNTDDGNYTFVFRISDIDGSYVFSARDSSPIPKYRYSAYEKPRSPVPDGARFQQIINEEIVAPVYTAVIDSASGDIDGDGKEESCGVSYGYTSGLYSFIFNVYKADEEKISTMFVCRHFEKLFFDKSEDGELLLRAVTDSGGEYSFEIGIKDGNVTLTEKELCVSIGEI